MRRGEDGGREDGWTEAAEEELFGRRDGGGGRARHGRGEWGAQGLRPPELRSVPCFRPWSWPATLTLDLACG